MSTVTLRLALHRDAPTDQAILVSETGDGDCVWLPRSRLIAYAPVKGKHETGPRGAKLQVVEVEIHERLAREKGLV